MTGALLLLSSLAVSGADADALLAKVDAAASRAHDVVMTLEIEVSKNGSEPLKRTLQVWQLGRDRRMVKFAAPSRLRGTGILVVDGATHLYSRAYNRVRRVAGKQAGGDWMGTGFSINDLARVEFATDYTPEIRDRSHGQVTLRLAPKDPSAHRHAGLRIVVRASDFLVVRITSLDRSGAALRTIDASDFRASGAYTLARTIRITERATGKTTQAKITRVAFDTGLKRDFFSERQLRRAP